MKEINLAENISNLTITASNESVWKRFCKGDHEALNLIYRKYINDLYHYGMHFCRDSERVKDCLQDLFQCLWLDREQLNTEVKNVRYYLITSLRRRLLRSLEKTRRNYAEELCDTFDFELISPREDTIIQDEILRQHLKQLHEGMTVLTRRQREAIYLRFYQNLSYDEIAKLMTMKVESVYNVISKAISLLKNTILFFLLIVSLRQ